MKMNFPITLTLLLLLLSITLPSSATSDLPGGIGMPDLTGIYGIPSFPGFGGPNGLPGGYGGGYGGSNGGRGWSGTWSPSTLCRERGRCYKRKLTCPAKCFKSWSVSGKNYGGGGGGGGCTMDCKKCTAYC